MTINEVINKFNNVKGGGNQYTARCPAHDDNANSLAIGCGEDGKILIYCHAGCDNEAILEAADLSINDLFVKEEKPVTKQIEAVYDYTDIDGNVLHSSVRYKNPKSFTQRRPDPNSPERFIYNMKDIKTVIYNLLAVIEAIKQNKPIFIVEGEKDADNLKKLGYTATTNPMGAGKWRDYHSDYLIGADVYIIPDNDEPGRKHVLSVGKSLTGKAKSIHVIDPKAGLDELPEHGDITDYLRTFNNRTEAATGFNKLISGAIPFHQYDNAESAEIGSFELMSAKDLQRADLPPIRFIVNGMLPQGLALLAAPSKYGKSWMTLDLCLSVADGEPFLGFNTEKCGVLYLALEDGYRRLQQRMNAILKNKKAPEEFDYTIKAPTLDTGLEGYLRDYINNHPKVGLIAIDVLQKVRSVSKSSSAYAAEYADLSILKRIADEFNITILLLHHNRKMGDDSDPFNMISGTMAIMGAADTTLILYREKRSDEETTLSITGRDVEMNSYKITWDKETCKQRLIGETEVLQEFSEQKEYENDPVVITIKALLKENPCGVSKTASDLLIDIIKYAGWPDGHTPTSLGRKIKSLTYKLYQYDGIIYKYARRMHTFEVEKTKVYQFPADHSEQTAIDDGGAEND